MSGFLSESELAELAAAELLPNRTPIPTQVVSSDEFAPDPQNEKQREVEARLLAMADDLGARQGLDRRGFFRTAAGMAASFLAMNEVYGALSRRRPRKRQRRRWPRSGPTRSRGNSSWTCTPTSCATIRAS